MRRVWFILACGVAFAVLAYCCVYYAGTAEQRSLFRQASPKLAWLKEAYHLDGRQFERIVELHTAYQTNCSEMCRRIDEKNTRLMALLKATNAVTAEIKKALAEAAEVRAECQAAMLEHFYEVSRAMPSDHGRRYLEWVQRQTLSPSHPMFVQPPQASPVHDRPGH